MRWPIRTQLLGPLLLLLIGVVGISTWTALASAHRARVQIEARVHRVGKSVSDGSYPLIETTLQQVADLSDADYLFVPTDEVKPITTLARFPEHLPPRQAVYQSWQELRLGPPVQVDGETYLCSGLRLRRGGAAGTLYIFYPERQLRDAQWEAIWPSLVLGGGVGVTSVALAVGVALRLSLRIRELERRTRLIAEGDFSPMPLPARRDELRDLAVSVNEMAERLARFEETTRRTERLRLLGQVSGGLAHQLRNGLTGARLAVQLYLRECEAPGDVSALEVALRQITLLETNLKRFLDLGREGGSRQQPCSLTTLASETIELLRPQCTHAGITLLWKPVTNANVVLGDAGQLGQLVLNLLGNAVEAAGPGGTVEVRLTPASGSRIVLEVFDSGPGPSPEVAARLFEPFVTGKPEGVGLGLAVARQIAEAHGGQVRWDREEGRTCFRVELPLAGLQGGS